MDETTEAGITERFLRAEREWADATDEDEWRDAYVHDVNALLSEIRALRRHVADLR